MLNCHIERIEQREISDAVASAVNISVDIKGRTPINGPIHEFAAALAKVARDRQIPMYLGHEPNGNYLNPAHHETNFGKLITGGKEDA